MKHRQHPLVCAACIHTAICLLLSAMLLTSCDNDEQPPADTTAPLVSNPLTNDDTTAVPTPNVPNVPSQPQDPIPNTGNNENNTGNPPPSGTVNIGNSTSGANESKGLSYTSNGNGTCTLTGLGTCSDVCLVIPTQNEAGERVTAVAAKALYGNTTVTAVFLPASVTSIGAMAFSAMPSLAYFSVDTQNPAYRSESGVLYTKDRSTLLSYPAAKSAALLTLPASVRTVSEMAFYGCSNLRGIAYEGSPSQWQQITIASGNNSLFGLNVQYNSATGK